MDTIELVYVYCEECEEEYMIYEDELACPICLNENVTEI